MEGHRHGGALSPVCFSLFLCKIAGSFKLEIRDLFSEIASLGLTFRKFACDSADCVLCWLVCETRIAAFCFGLFHAVCEACGSY